MTAIIEVKNLKYSYDNFILGKLNFKIESGQWVSIIGKNGSGKSTLTRLIDGLIEADEGEIIINGKTLNEKNIWDIRTQIGIVFQNPDNQFVGANVEDDVAFGLENRQLTHHEMVARVNDALAAVNMLEFAKHEPAKLSGGQKQRVAIAGILAIHPKIIILDEATSMLDPEGRRTLLGLIHRLKEKYKFTVLAITHDIDEAVDADRVMILNNGKIVDDDIPQNIFKNNDLIKLGLDLPFTEKLKNILKQQGINLTANYLSKEEMAAMLWQLSLKM